MYLVILQALPVLIFSYMAQVLMKKESVIFSNLTWETFSTNPLKTLGMFLFNWQIMLGFVLASIGGFGVTLISWLVLNESISPGKIFGTVIITIGMLIVARG